MTRPTESQRLQAIAICDAIQANVKKLEADFAKLKDAADQFRADSGIQSAADYGRVLSDVARAMGE